MSLGGRVAAWAMLVALCAAPDVSFAQDRATRIPVRTVGGRIIARLDLSTPVRRIPVHMFVELEASYGIEIHNRALSPLGVNDGHPVTLHFQGIEITREHWSLGHGPDYNGFTRLYAKELSETAVVGTIGSDLLRAFHVVLDLGQGVIELSTPRAESPDEPELPEGAVAVPASLDHGVVWVPVRYGEDQASGSMALATNREDTVFDRGVCHARGKPAGDVGPVLLDTVDLAKYVAFRPDPMRYRHVDGAVLVSGTRLLEHFRVEIDRVNRRVIWQPTRAAKFPNDELEFFRARAASGAAPLEAWLEKNKANRLAPEGADLLLRRLLRAGAKDRKRMERALTWVNDTRPEDLRTSNALRAMQRLEEMGQRRYAPFIGNLGLKTARKDRDPTAVHKIHSILGEQFLEERNQDKAWRHLLSAAFGLAEIGPNARPEEGRGDAARVHLNLGRFYEWQERYARSFSRYVQAVVFPETGTEALEGLMRVGRRLEGEDRMSHELVERLVAGRTPGFGAPDTFEPTKKNPARRRALVEGFTSAHAGAALPSDLALDALREHFGEHAIVVSHHPSAVPSPLVSRAADQGVRAYSVSRLPTVVFDGDDVLPCGGREDTKDEHYEEFKKRTLQSIAIPTKVEMDGELVRDGAKLRGKVRMKLRHDIPDAVVGGYVVEKGVVYPGPTRIVVHHNVVRGSLWKDGTRPLRTRDGVMEIEFTRDLQDVEREAAAHQEALKKRGALISMAAPPIDARHTAIVVFVRRGNRILHSLWLEPPGPADADDEEGTE